MAPDSTTPITVKPSHTYPPGNFYIESVPNENGGALTISAIEIKLKPRIFGSKFDIETKDSTKNLSMIAKFFRAIKSLILMIIGKKDIDATAFIDQVNQSFEIHVNPEFAKEKEYIEQNIDLESMPVAPRYNVQIIADRDKYDGRQSVQDRVESILKSRRMKAAFEPEPEEPQTLGEEKLSVKCQAILPVLMNNDLPNFGGNITKTPSSSSQNDVKECFEIKLPDDLYQARIDLPWSPDHHYSVKQKFYLQLDKDDKIKISSNNIIEFHDDKEKTQISQEVFPQDYEIDEKMIEYLATNISNSSVKDFAVFLNLANLAFLETSPLDGSEIQKALQRKIQDFFKYRPYCFPMKCEAYCDGEEAENKGQNMHENLENLRIVLTRQGHVKQTLDKIIEVTHQYGNHPDATNICSFLKSVKDQINILFEVGQDEFKDLQGKLRRKTSSVNNLSNGSRKDRQNGPDDNPRSLTQTNQTSSNPEAPACSAGNQKG